VSAATQARAPVVTRAFRDAIPVVLAYAPFGLALGATLAATHIPPLIAWSSSPLLFGGAAQLLAVQLLGAGASVGVVVLGALVVNARMLLYGAALAPYTAAWPGRWRWLGAYFLIDPVYALAVGPAVLAAITLPAFVAPHGSVSFTGTVPALLGAVVALMAWRCAKKNLPIALFGGLAVWWLTSWAFCAAGLLCGL